MFAFDISGLALEVAPPDTGRVRLVAVTSGLLEARPHEIGADFPDRVARGVWLRACSGGGGGNGDAQAYLNDVFDASRLNARFDKSRKTRSARVVALRDIGEGEEIFASYGRSYWTARGFDVDGRSLLPFKERWRATLLWLLFG